MSVEKTQIKFGEVRLGYKAQANINTCLSTNQVTMGPMVEEFEQKWGKINETPFNVAMNSGTSALIGLFLSLYDFGARPGMEVIVPSLSFVASFTSIIAAGFKPVFVDIDLNTLNINTDLIEQEINENTIAILGVSLMGKPYQAEIIQKLCHKYDLWHFCDNCEAHLCKRQFKRMEMYCDAACYSFFAAHLAFSGEFSITSTFNNKLDEILRSIRNHGREGDYHSFYHQRFGLNLKPTDIHAAIGLESLDEIQQTFDKRKKNLNYLQIELVNKESVILSLEDENDLNCPHALSIVKNPYCNGWSIEELKTALNEENIEFKRNFGAAGSHKALERYVTSPENAPNADIAGEGIHIGVHQYLSDSDLYRIYDVLREVII